MNILRKKINEFIETNKYMQKEITKVEKAALIDHLNRILEELGLDYRTLGIKVPVKQLNPFLKKFGYTISDVPGHRKGTLFILKKVD